MDVRGRRLRNQRLTRSELRKPVDVVAWLGAVQAQDYAGAKWALGLRAKHLTDADVDRAFDEGSILRTHLMRPTWPSSRLLTSGGCWPSRPDAEGCYPASPTAW